jgi:hypothetical protein
MFPLFFQQFLSLKDELWDSIIPIKLKIKIGKGQMSENNIFWNQLKHIEKSDFCAYVFFAGQKRAKSNETGKKLQEKKFQTMKVYLWEYCLNKNGFKIWI